MCLKLYKSNGLVLKHFSFIIQELALIGYSIEKRNRLTELLYDEIMSSILRIFKKLDLSVKQSGTLVQVRKNIFLSKIKTNCRFFFFFFFFKIIQVSVIVLDYSLVVYIRNFGDT